MTTVFRKLALPASVALILAACGAAAPPGGSPVTGGPSANPGQTIQPVQPGGPGGPAGPSLDSCALLTDEEIATATGQQVDQRTASTLTQVFSSVCDIALDEFASLTISVLPTGGRAMYETSFEPFIGEGEFPPIDAAVSGLGDKAGRTGDDTLMVLSGDVLFDIHYIDFQHPDKFPVVHYLAERILARLSCISTGCPPLPVPPAPTIGPPTPAPTKAAVDPGTLPSTGAQARVVNLYSEAGKPVEVDVFAYAWSETEMREVAALVATVPYGQASAWFNPGLVQSPFSGEEYTKVEIFRRGDHGTPLAGTSEFLGPGTVTTINVWQEEVFEGQPGAWLQTIYAEHPTYPISEAPADQGLLISSYNGLKGEADEPVLFASVGDGCLESPFGRSDPEIPNAQPLSNDLVLPVGQHTLTVHEEPFGEVPTCETKPLGPGAPVSVAAGDRWMAFAYRLTESADVSLLVVPFNVSP